MSLTFDGVALKKFTHDGHKVKKWTHDGVKVWSGASEVKYYNGSTLLATKEVDEGESVLNPGITPTLSGRVFKGWSLTDGGEALTEYVATGEAITLYAVFYNHYKYDIYRSGESESGYIAVSVNGGAATRNYIRFYVSGESYSDSNVSIVSYPASGTNGVTITMRKAGKVNGSNVNAGYSASIRIAVDYHLILEFDT